MRCSQPWRGLGRLTPAPPTAPTSVPAPQTRTSRRPSAFRWRRVSKTRCKMTVRIANRCTDHKFEFERGDKFFWSEREFHATLCSSGYAAHTQKNVDQGSATHQSHGCVLRAAIRLPSFHCLKRRTDSDASKFQADCKRVPFQRSGIRASISQRHQIFSPAGRARARFSTQETCILLQPAQFTRRSDSVAGCASPE